MFLFFNPKTVDMKLTKAFILTLLTFTLSVNGNSSITALSNPVSPGTIQETLPGKKEKMIEQMRWFAGLTMKEYEKLRGKKLNFFERVSFRLNQHRVKQMLKDYSYGDEPTTLQKISWLVKGLILGPIALILGYIFLRDEQRELLKWIWFGFAGWCILVAIILLTI